MPSILGQLPHVLKLHLVLDNVAEKLFPQLFRGTVDRKEQLL